MLVNNDLLNPSTKSVSRNIQGITITVRAKSYPDGTPSGGVEIRSSYGNGAYKGKFESALYCPTREQLRRRIGYVYKKSKDHEALLLAQAGFNQWVDENFPDTSILTNYVDRHEKEVGTSVYSEMSLEVIGKWKFELGLLL